MIITIKQGDSTTLTEVVTGLADLVGYSSKLYIKTEAGVDLATITGSIDTLTITYQIVNENSKGWAVKTYKYETKIWDNSDHVYTLSHDDFVVEAALENDPS